MKFHAALLAPNGHVSAREWRDGDRDVNGPLSRKMIAEFKRLLRDHLTDDPIRPGKFRGCMGDRDCSNILEFEWQQTEPLSALGKFYVRGLPRPAAACRGLQSIKERAALVVMPGDKGRLCPDDWRTIGNLCPCFAVAFFTRAEAAIQKIEAFWHDRGFRNAATPTDHLRN